MIKIYSHPLFLNSFFSMDLGPEPRVQGNCIVIWIFYPYDLNVNVCIPLAKQKGIQRLAFSFTYALLVHTSGH